MTIHIPEALAWFVTFWLYVSLFADLRLLYWRKRLTKAREEYNRR